MAGSASPAIRARAFFARLASARTGRSMCGGCTSVVARRLLDSRRQSMGVDERRIALRAISGSHPKKRKGILCSIGPSRFF